MAWLHGNSAKSCGFSVGEILSGVQFSSFGVSKSDLSDVDYNLRKR